MELEKLDCALSVCKLKTLTPDAFNSALCFAARTDDEVSLVCLSADAPEDALRREDGWRAFRICGPLEFSLVGVLAPIAAILAENRIGIFAVSTYDTDYILVKAESFDAAHTALCAAGYTVTPRAFCAPRPRG